MSYLYCTECGGKVIRNESGELVCTQCGLVHNEIILPEYGSGKRVEVPKEFQIPEVHNQNIRQEYAHLMKIDRIIRSTSSSYQRALQCLLKIGEKLNIPREVIEYAYNLYLKAVRHDLHKEKDITHYKVALTCLLIAIKKFMRNPVSIKECLRVFREEGHRITLGDISKIIVALRRVLQLETVVLDLRQYIVRIVNELYSNPYIEMYILKKSKYLYPQSLRGAILQEALKISEKISPSIRAGKNPQILALAIVYEAERRVRRRFGITRIYTQNEIARRFGYSVHTLREYVKLIRSLQQFHEVSP
ncbi:MAG: hypothetical protein DRJ40_05615 [Thermoprotei archaeon]|nr:MAG: hypothetical protein DRJ40_05615 [Thermoprotei archaeon]